jgi:hypothetical protein
MPTWDFDFQRYVARRKGAREAERREAAAYAYRGDLKVRRTLGRLRPVTLALEASARLWRHSARAELLGTAVRASETRFPRVAEESARAAERLHVAAPPVFVSPHLSVSAHTFGTDDEPTILLHASLADGLGDAELRHALGAELGRVQNGHVLYATALYYLVRREATFLRWIVRPAVLALASWSRRAQVTADRAGLLASRDLDASLSAIEKLAAPIGPPEGGAQTASPTLDVGRRARVLELFAGSAYYHGASGGSGGASADEVDARIAEVLRGAGAKTAEPGSAESDEDEP